MIALLILLLAQDAGCSAGICPPADIQSVYLRGWEAARAAAREGGSPESLAPVREAIAALEQMAGGAHGPAEIARYVLLAAADAAQEERDEMAIFIDHAVSLERQQIDLHAPGAPGITAHEAAGDLWLQVRRYADARAAYERAKAVLGSTPRIEEGLARLAAAERR